MSFLHNISVGHEARFASGLLMLEGMMLGIIDSLAPNDTVKAFGWLAISTVIAMAVIYELIWYETPDRPDVVATGFGLVFLGSLWGIWNITWLFFTILIQGFNFIQNGMISVAPFVSLSVNVWTTTTILALLGVGIGHLIIEKYGRKIKI